MELSLTGISHPKRGKAMNINGVDNIWVNDFHRRDCFCNLQFNVKACSIQGIFKTADVIKNDPESLSCDPATVDLMSTSLSSLVFS